MCRLIKVLRVHQSLRNVCNQASSSVQSDIRAQCRKFAKDNLLPIASEIDRLGCFPKKQITELGKIGLMAITAPVNYGGSGLNMSAVSLAVEEISRGCASTGAIISIHNILYIDFLTNHATEKQKEKFLRPYTTSIPGAFALSESNAGSDVANLSTVAVREGDNYVLNGVKTWVTSALDAEAVIIFATVDKSLGRNGITAFLVPLSTPGVLCSKPDEKLGIRAASSCQIYLNDVVVSKENVVGNIGEGFKLAMQQLNKARIGIASQAIGIAQASLETALEYACCRQAFGKKLVNMQAVQIRLARIASQIEAARLLVRKSAELCDKNEDFVKFSSMAKLLASEAATFSAHQCIQILGGMGYTNEMPAERYYRDARVTEIYGGVSDIQMLIIADQLVREANLGDH